VVFPRDSIIAKRVAYVTVRMAELTGVNEFLTFCQWAQKHRRRSWIYTLII